MGGGGSGGGGGGVGGGGEGIGESRNFYTYIRTEQIRIFVIISSILNDFSCGKAQILHCLFVASCYPVIFPCMLYFPTQPQTKTESLCSRLCRKLQSITNNNSIFVFSLQRQGICTVSHENLPSKQEVMNNFLQDFY